MDDNINENNQVLEKKEYMLDVNNSSYQLIIMRDNEYLDIELNELYNNKILTIYINKFSFDDLIDISKLNMYDNLENILELINDVYLNNKISLISNNENMNLIIKYPIGFREHEFTLTLNKKQFEINNDFNILFNKIKLFKKNKKKITEEKLNDFEKLLNNLQKCIVDKLNDNKEVITDLKNKLKENNNLLKEKDDTIKRLKEKIGKENLSKIETDRIQQDSIDIIQNKRKNQIDSDKKTNKKNEKDKIKIFRETYGLVEEDYTDEILLNALEDNNFNYENSFESLFL